MNAQTHRWLDNIGFLLALDCGESNLARMGSFVVKAQPARAPKLMARIRRTDGKLEAKHHENTVRSIFDLKPEPKEAAMPNVRTDRPQFIFRYDLEERPVRPCDDSRSLILVCHPGFLFVTPNAGVGR